MVTNRKIYKSLEFGRSMKFKLVDMVAESLLKQKDKPCYEISGEGRFAVGRQNEGNQIKLFNSLPLAYKKAIFNDELVKGEYFERFNHVSRSHAVFEINGEGVYVSDNESTHHTYRRRGNNTKKINPGEREKLQNGDLVYLGQKYPLRFVEELEEGELQIAESIGGSEDVVEGIKSELVEESELQLAEEPPIKNVLNHK